MLFGSINNRRFFYVLRSQSWSHYEATMLNATKLQVRDHMNESDEVIEFRDDVLLWSLGYGHLIAISKTQCFVHREANNWSTSVTADLRDKCPQFVKQMDK